MFAVFGRVRKSFQSAGVASIAALTLSACVETTSVGGGSGPSVDTSKAVTVALLVPGASASENDNQLAQSLENAARLAMADLDGVNIDLRVYNTAGNATLAASKATEAVQDGAKIILGPVYSASANAVGLAVANSNVNVLSFSNNTTIAGGNVFVLGMTFENTAKRLLGHAVRNGRGNVMIVSEQTVGGTLGAASIRKAAAQTGAAIVGETSYEFSQNGLVQAVPTIASNARSNGANSVFFTAETVGGLPLITQLLPENRIAPPEFQFLGLTRWDLPAETLALPGVQGGWYAMPDPALEASFKGRYQAAFGSGPLPVSSVAYDSIAAVGALLARGSSDALTTSSLTQSSGFAGVNGVFRLLPDGTNERGLAIAEIRDNQVVIIDPAPRSFGGAGF